MVKHSTFFFSKRAYFLNSKTSLVDQFGIDAHQQGLSYDTLTSLGLVQYYEKAH